METLPDAILLAINEKQLEDSCQWSWYGRWGSAYLAQCIDLPHLLSSCIAALDASGRTAESKEADVVRPRSG